MRNSYSWYNPIQVWCLSRWQQPLFIIPSSSFFPVFHHILKQTFLGWKSNEKLEPIENVILWRLARWISEISSRNLSNAAAAQGDETEVIAWNLQMFGFPSRLLNNTCGFIFQALYFILFIFLKLRSILLLRCCKQRESVVSFDDKTIFFPFFFILQQPAWKK